MRPSPGRRIGAEIEHVQRRGGRLLPHERVRERGARGRLDTDLFGLLDLATLCGGDERNPADRRDLGAGQRHTRESRESLRPDRRRGVVGRADALQGENGCSGALLQRRGGAAGALARLVADVVLLGAPENRREDRGRDRAEEECKGKAKAYGHLAGVRRQPRGLEEPCAISIRVRECCDGAC